MTYTGRNKGRGAYPWAWEAAQLLPRNPVRGYYDSAAHGTIVRIGTDACGRAIYASMGNGQVSRIKQTQVEVSDGKQEI